jgi:hypothetical protein
VTGCRALIGRAPVAGPRSNLNQTPQLSGALATCLEPIVTVAWCPVTARGSSDSLARSRWFEAGLEVTCGPARCGVIVFRPPGRWKRCVLARFVCRSLSAVGVYSRSDRPTALPFTWPFGGKLAILLFEGWAAGRTTGRVLSHDRYGSLESTAAACCTALHCTALPAVLHCQTNRLPCRPGDGGKPRLGQIFTRHTASPPPGLLHLRPACYTYTRPATPKQSLLHIAFKNMCLGQFIVL